MIKTRIKFFKNHSYDLKKVIIGQRLGVFLKTCKPHIRDLFQMKSEIPIDYSSDRRVAALGAAWIKSMLPEVNLITNEPLISVGLILPEDKKSSILIEDTSIKKI